MTDSAEFWISELNLIPHPEGGFFREVYRSGETIENLPVRYRGSRCFSTSIYFLLRGNQFSAFHRIKSDETWHFYAGCKLEIFCLDELKGFTKISLGQNLQNHETVQYTILQNTWFAAQPAIDSSYALVGCTVAPGFEFDDFEMGKLERLTDKFPDHIEVLKKFCIY